MRINIATTHAELAAMGMDADQLRVSVTDALSDHAWGADGERVEYSGFNVTVEVFPSPVEFNAAING